jgi:hypothetical protein
MPQKGFASFLVVLVLAALIGSYLLYSGILTLPLHTTSQNLSNILTLPTSKSQTIKGELTYEQKLPKDNGPVHPGGWVSRYWKDSDPLIILIIPSDQTIKGTISALEFQSYKGLLPFLKGSRNYGDATVNIEIFNDPIFLEPHYYNKVVGTEEYCQKILGVYINNSERSKRASTGKKGCVNNYSELKI